MKVEIIKAKKVFKPIEVKLIIEKESEMNNIIDYLEETESEGFEIKEFEPLEKLLRLEKKKLNE